MYEFILENYGPMAVIILYMYIQQKRLKNAVLCLADNVSGVERSEVRESFKIRAD